MNCIYYNKELQEMFCRIYDAIFQFSGEELLGFGLGSPGLLEHVYRKNP